MKKLVFLEYAFIFGDDTFDNLYDFEKLLSQVFKVKGYEARIIDAIRGSVSRRVIYVQKNTDLLTTPTQADRNRITGGKKI